MEKFNVTILHVNRTSSGKTVLQYGINAEDTANGYGLAILTQWFDNTIPYERLKDYKLKSVPAEYEYTRPSQKGYARQVLTALYGIDGTNLLG